MGTRHLIAIKAGGEYKVAQYGQWDGYPSGQGVGVLDALRELESIEAFKGSVLACRGLTEEEFDDRTAECGASKGSNWVSRDVSLEFQRRFPHLHRDCGADIIGIIDASPPGLEVRLSLEFAGSSLWCEWAYVVDLDAGTFEVFEGFNKSPLPEGERFHFLQEDNPEGRDGYFPVAHAKTYRLENLPSEEEFLADLEPQEEDED